MTFVGTFHILSDTYTSSSSSNLGTGFTRECIRFRENFAQCRVTQQSSTDYLQVKLYTGGSWSSCCQDAP
jgi:hypothetical protein